MFLYTVVIKKYFTKFATHINLYKMKRDKLIYYISTALLTVIVLFSVGMYFFNHDNVAVMFTNLGYPAYIIYPYAIAKLLGLITIWFFRKNTIKEWAYASFFFAFVLAFFAHIMISDGEQTGAIIAIVLLLTSYYFGKKI